MIILPHYLSKYLGVMKKLNTYASILLLILALLYAVFGMSQTENKTGFQKPQNNINQNFGRNN